MISLILCAAPAHVIVGEAPRPEAIEWGAPLVVTPRLRLSTRASATSDVPVDADGNTLQVDPTLDTQLRIGLHADTGRLSSWLNLALDLEYDVVDVRGGTSAAVPVAEAPDRARTTDFLRTLSGRLSIGPFLTVGGGFTTNHWGLGLVANDGAHGWSPGSAYFTDPRDGDRVLRGFAATGPWTDARIVAFAAIDRVEDDDVLRSGDRARQALGAVRVGEWAGAYVAHRIQESRGGAQTTATVVDGFVDRRIRLPGWRLQLAGEIAWIVGETELGPSTAFPTHDVEQLGWVARIGADVERFGALVDVFYASGDADASDGVQGGFKADPNFDQGLLLFPYLLAATTGRAPFTAANPELVGYPADDLDRLSSDGVVTNTLSVFPRFWARPVTGLELYGGALFAFAAVPPGDPFQSRLNGGTPTSAFGGAAGDYLGTEVDFGLRYRALLFGTELVLGAEGGLFTPGDAFRDAAGQRRGAASGGRLMLRYTL